MMSTDTRQMSCSGSFLGKPAVTVSAKSIALRVLGLAALLFLARLLVSSALGMIDLLPGPGGIPFSQVLGLFLGSLIYSVVLTYIVVRSRWSGVRLALLVFWIVFGITTLLAQVESIVFLQYLVSIMSAEMLTKVIEQATLYALFCALFAPLIHGRLLAASQREASAPSGLLKSMGVGEWAWKLAAIAVIYVVIYIAAGMFIFRTLAGPAFDEYYHGLQMPSWIVPFQFARAMLWVLVALPILRAIEGKRWEAALAMALAFSFLMSGFLFAPNSVMPDRIRLSHLVELTVSNFVFGWIVAWMLSRGFSTRRNEK
jgi:hypothetical protein